MAFDLRPARARAVALPPLVPIIELRRPAHIRTRWRRGLGLIMAALVSAALWALILVFVWRLFS